MGKMRAKIPDGLLHGIGDLGADKRSKRRLVLDRLLAR